MGAEWERMVSGELYDPGAPDLAEARLRARRLTSALNATDAGDLDERRHVLEQLLGELGDGAWVEPPFRCDYGANISLGGRVFVNFDCVFLDCAPVTIGARTLLGPSVHVYAATHTTDVATRRRGLELARPVAVGADCWIGGAVVIGPGVSIGDGTTVGAGSVVLRDVPAGVVAAGNPCRVLRDAPSG